MTLEKAADLVNKLMQIDREAAVDLFVHFDNVFKLSEDKSGEAITEFARCCGYIIATDVSLLSIP